MNKLTLLGIATQPKYDDNDQWTGVEIYAHIEAEVQDVEQRGLHRVEIKLEITQTLAQAVKNYGYDETIERFLMKRIESCLFACGRKWDGVWKDSGIIYDVIRLKLPRFVAKSVDRIFYSQNFRTGEIEECTEDMLDRKL
jgi:hypothetical protein